MPGSIVYAPAPKRARKAKPARTYTGPVIVGRDPDPPMMPEERKRGHELADQVWQRVVEAAASPPADPPTGRKRMRRG